MADDVAERHQQLLDQYEPDDSDFDQELDAQPPPPEPKAETPKSPKPKAAKATPPKDPDTGKFTKADAAGHPQGLRRLAKRLDFSDEEIDSYPTSELLDIVDRLSGERFKQTHQSVSTGRDTPAPPEPLADSADPPKSSKFDLKSLREKYSDNADLMDIFEHLLERDSSREKDIAGFKDYIRNEGVRRDGNESDKGFSDLGEDYHDIFGKGNIDELTPGDPAIMRRVNVFQSLKNFPIKGISQRAAIRQRAKELNPITAKPKPQVEETYEPDEALPPSRNRQLTRNQLDEAAMAPVNGRKAGPERAGKRKATRSVAELLKRQVERNGDGPEEDDLP